MPSQWETMLQCNVVSHWLGAFTKWSLQWVHWTNGQMKWGSTWFWWGLKTQKLPPDGTLYAATFRCRRHYVFGLSVLPSASSLVSLSVQSLKYPLATCTWVHWSIWPTRDRFSACPAIRPNRFPGIIRRMHGQNSLKFWQHQAITWTNVNPLN